MDDYERYNSLRISLLYEKDICKYILDVFTKPGMVITADRLYHPNKPHSVGKFLVLSDQMINSAESVKVSINELTGQREGNVGDSRTVKKRSSNTLFYMAQYGGSKTQFFAYLMDVISSNHPNVLFIKFDNLNSIQPNIIYDQLISQIYKKIVINSGVKYEEDFNKIKEKDAQIQVALNQSRNLDKFEALISEFLNSNLSPIYKNKVKEIDQLVRESIIIDPNFVLQKVVDLMKVISSMGYVIVFLFDEVNEWFNNDSSQPTIFVEDFNLKQAMMRNILEIPKNDINSYMVFASVDRIIHVLQTKVEEVANTSSVFNRLSSLYQHSELIIEPGVYSDKINEAFYKIAAYYSVVSGIIIDKTIFNKILEYLPRRLGHFTRRTANGKMMSLLDIYSRQFNRMDSIKDWDNNYLRLGNVIHKNLGRILKILGNNAEIRELPIDPTRVATTKKIDGYFTSYYNKKIYLEIKVCKAYTSDKNEQILKFLQLEEKEFMVFILFTKQDLKEIKAIINKYCQDNGYDSSILDRLKFIHISDPYALPFITAIDAVESDPKLYDEFLRDSAKWFDFFTDISKQLLDISKEIKEIIGPSPEDPPMDPTAPLEAEFTAQQSAIMEMLKKIRTWTPKLFTQKGFINKNKLEKWFGENPHGIPSFEDFIEILQKNNLFDKMTDTNVFFAKEIIQAKDKSEPEYMDAIKKIIISVQKESTIEKYV